MCGKGCLMFVFLVASLSSILNAQETNDELKEQMRESFIIPEIPHLQQLHQHNLVQLDLNSKSLEVLKVSPFTWLPTKYDRIRIPPKQEVLKVHMHVIPTCAPPINMRPAGSVVYVHDAGKIYIFSNAGQLVVPSGYGTGPIPKRHKRKENLLNSLNK